MYRNAFHGMDESTMGEYGASLPQDKDGILATGRTVPEHNAHIRMARLARLVAYLASADHPERDNPEHATTIINARNALAAAEGVVTDCEASIATTSDDERAATMASAARSVARPQSWYVVDGDGEATGEATKARESKRAATRAARNGTGDDFLSALQADERAEKGDKGDAATGRKPVAPLPAHACDAPRAEGETHRAYWSRRRACPGCLARRAHATHGIRPAVDPSSAAPAWSGLQGDRVAARGRSPAVGGNGIGARRMGRTTR